MQAREIIEKYALDKRVIIGVSGGVDSMTLLSITLGVLPRENVRVVHIEHGIRGEEAENDARFVADFCEKNGVRCDVFHADIPSLARQNKRSEETEARIYRRETFFGYVERGEADCILLAHNRDDRIESVLMHILRGCSLGGLVGMKVADGKVIRPLLDTSRAEIEEYAKANGIEYRVDSTNFDVKYDRNFIRRKVLPLIRERYSPDSLLRLSDSAQETEEYLSRVFSDKISESDGAVTVSVADATSSIGGELVYRALKAAGITEDAEKKHVDAILKAARSGNNGDRVSLPHGFEAAVEYGRIAFYKAKDKTDDEIDFAPGFTPFADGCISVAPYDGDFAKGVCAFDLNKIPQGAVVRFRRDGDVFRPYKGGEKKLKEYFIDLRIPLRKRDFIPLVCRGNKVLCVVGEEISDEIKIDGKTRDVYSIKYEVQE